MSEKLKTEYTADDFSRAELQRKFGDDAEWFYKRLAQIANDELPAIVEARLQERLRDAPTVYGCKSERTETGPYYWEIQDEPREDDTHTAKLIDVREIK